MKSQENKIDIFAAMGLKKDDPDLLEEIIRIPKAKKEKKDQNDQKDEFVFKNVRNGKTFSIQERYERYRNKYQGLDLFQLMDKRESLEKISYEQIEREFKTDCAISIFREMIYYEILYINQIATESFPNGPDFFFVMNTSKYYEMHQNSLKLIYRFFFMGGLEPEKNLLPISSIEIV